MHTRITEEIGTFFPCCNFPSIVHLSNKPRKTWVGSMQERTWVDKMRPGCWFQAHSLLKKSLRLCCI
jgi:hypothetical protein